MHYSRGMLSLSAPYPPSHLRELSLFHQLVTERSHSLPVVSQTPPSLERRVVSSSCLPLSHTTAAVSLFDSFIPGTPCLATWKPLFYRLSICVRVGFGLVIFSPLSPSTHYHGRLPLSRPFLFWCEITVRVDEGSPLTEKANGPVPNASGCAGVIRIHCVRP